MAASLEWNPVPIEGPVPIPMVVVAVVGAGDGYAAPDIDAFPLYSSSSAGLSVGKHERRDLLARLGESQYLIEFEFDFCIPGILHSRLCAGAETPTQMENIAVESFANVLIPTIIIAALAVVDEKVAVDS